MGTLIIVTIEGCGLPDWPCYRPVARIRITPVTLHGGVRKSRAGGPPLWRIVLTCDIRRHLGHLPGRFSAIEGVCRSVFGTVQYTVRHKRAELSFVKKTSHQHGLCTFCHRQNPRCPPSVGVNYPYTLDIRHIVNDVTCNGSIICMHTVARGREASPSL